MTRSLKKPSARYITLQRPLPVLISSGRSSRRGPTAFSDLCAHATLYAHAMNDLRTTDYDPLPVDKLMAVSDEEREWADSEAAEDHGMRSTGPRGPNGTKPHEERAEQDVEE